MKAQHIESSCQLRKANLHVLTKIGQQKIRKKMLPGLMILYLCCDIYMVGSEFGTNNMIAWIHSSSYC